MPLARFEVRNEYGLGAAELFSGAKKYDSKDVLEGVAVAGMVGVLRQLGDLAELAAEIFQDLQEQVMAAATRSHKMMVRIQQMEETLPTVEKAVLSQKSHVYFAYTAGIRPGAEMAMYLTGSGIDWHANVQPRENHLVHSDTPKLIFEYYEKCRGPPRLELLDKFDPSGPGACLKKYSDPSIFKTALTRTNPQNAEKSQGERNAKNVKEKGARQRNLEVPHIVPTVNRERRSRRIQFSPTNSFVQNLSGESGTAFGVRLGSEVGTGSSSFNSRTTSDGAECAFVASSVQNKEPEHEGLLSGLQMQYFEASDLVFPYEPVSDLVFPCEQVAGSHDIDTNKSLQEESISNSPSITWVEKTEIVNPADRAPENIMEAQSEASETSSVLSDSSNLENEASVLANGGLDVKFGARQIVHGEVSNKNQFGEAENESDSDMTEEFETDFDDQTKETADLQSPNFKISGREDEKNSASFSTESNLSNKHAMRNFAKSVSKEDFHQQSRNLLEVADMLKDLEPTIGDTAATNSNAPGLPGSETIPNLNYSKKSDSLILDSTTTTKPQFLVSDSKPSKFWTNGGLLGLEPSKPPDSKVLNSANGDCLHSMQANGQCLSSETSIPKSHSDESTEKVNLSFRCRKPTEKSSGLEEGRERSSDYVGLNNLPPDQLTTTSAIKIFLVNHSRSTLDHDKQANSKDSSSTDRTSDAHGCGLVNSSIGNLGTEFRAIPDVLSPSNEENKKNLGSLTGIFCNDRFDINISNSLGESSKFMKKSHLKFQNSLSIRQKGSNGNLKQTSSISNHGENLDHKESTDFLCSSPPVQHMKISFNPVGGLETPKLKLKITDELHFSEGTTDFVFPSFQLLPEHSIQPKDIDYESDDETMYGSSLYMSDELMSHLSEASAEQWESDEAPADQGSKMYDASHRTSSVRSISSSGEPEGIASDSIYAGSDYKSMETDNGLQTIHAGSVLDLPSFVADGSLEGRRKDENNFTFGNCQDSVLQHLNESMPPPPPLPPLQWRVRKNQFNATDDEYCIKSEALSHTKHLQGSAFNSFQHMKLDPPMQQRTNEAVKRPPKSHDTALEHKSTSNLGTTADIVLPFNSYRIFYQDQRKVSMVINGQDIERKEDLLHQINRQSLNLRCAVKERPMRKVNPPGDVKVTAILEKANAIRQAFVGSDEEDDDD
ncbi:hypothetical protein Sjap_000499 [Stephania japonica]|uniref:Protein SCAR n=1 Tax=Stephania japonica TaxID=461633 RepID=A0AAP0KJZ3_9MAGN